MPTQVRRAILFEQNVLNYLCQSFKIFFTERQYARALQSSAISYTATCGNSSAVVSLPFSHLAQARTRARLSVQLYFPVQASRWRRKGDWSCWLLCVRLVAATEFALLSFDTHSTHVFNTIDGIVQRLTFAATNPQVREGLARGISNVFPLFGLALLTLSTVFSTDKSSFRTRVIVCWVSLASALATVDALKDSFARLRPAGTLLQSYAFPSGHTCGSNLLMGLFLFLLLDPLWDSTQNMSVSEDSDSDQGGNRRSPAQFDQRLII